MNNKDNIAYVFDFDCTLTYNHAYDFVNDDNVFYIENIIPKVQQIKIKKILKNEKYDNNKIYDISDRYALILIIFGSLERYVSLQLLFKSIGKQNLFISSRGIKYQIINILGLCNLLDFYDINNIYDNNTKKDHLLNILLDSRDVVYADDTPDEKNIVVEKNIENNLIINKFNDFHQYSIKNKMFIFIELPHEEKGFDLYHIKNMLEKMDFYY